LFRSERDEKEDRLLQVRRPADIIIARDLPGKGIGTDDLPLIFTGIFISCQFRII
jgi:hypothetical protein